MTSQTPTALAALEYPIIETDTASVDLMAGGRLWSVDTEIELQGPADAVFSDGDTWFDPIIGARARLDLTEEVYLTGWGMIGGFGVGLREDVLRDWFRKRFVQFKQPGL